MAKANPGYPFLGSFGNLSVYKRHDMDQLIVRVKGGPSKEQVLTSPIFENTRRNIEEFKGRSTATMWLLRALEPLRPLANFNIAGPLNALIKPVQAMDPDSEWGQRHVLFTKMPRILEGFSLNKERTFDSIIRNTLRFTLNRETLEASIDIPALVPGINFHVEGKFPLYSLIINPVVMPNVYYDKLGYQPSHKNWVRTMHDTVITEWYPVLNGSPEQSHQMKIKFTPPDENYILMLSVGIRFGTIGADGEIKQLRRTGAAKIIGVV
jgi:hypothetical protein